MEQQFISESCSWFHTVENFESIIEMQRLSGIGLNRLGVFSECVASPELKYFLLQYQINMIQCTFYTGICYSANCTATDLLYISRSFDSYIPAPYNSLTITQILAPKTDWTFGLTFAFCLFGLYIAWCLWAGLQDTYQKWKRVGRRKVIEIFSFVHSFGLLVQRTSNNERLRLMVGLRSWAFILMCIYNISSVLLKRPSYMWLSQLSALLGVFYYSFDIWLLVSGFYLGFELSRNWSKVRSHKLVINFLIRKFIKLFLLNLLVNVMVNVFLIPTGSGPLWTIFKQDYYRECQSNFLFDLLLFSNFTTNRCDYWLWIWQTELQLAALGCAMFILLKSSSSLRYYLCGGFQLFVLGMGYLGVLLAAEGINYNAGLLQGSVSRWPTTRGAAYVLGFNLGYWYFWFRSQKNKEKLRVLQVSQYRLVRIILPLSGLCLLVFCFLYCFMGLQFESNVQEKCMLQTLHILIPLGVALFISCALLGFRDPISHFFHGQIHSLISRLSVSAYAVQYIIFALIIESRSQDIYINAAKAISFCSSSIFSSLVAGFLFAVFFQMPLHKLLGIRLQGEPNKYIELQ